MGKIDSVWVVSKYAVLPEFGPPNRQYFIAKFLNKQNIPTRLITSRSCAYTKLPGFIGTYKSALNQDKVPYTILNGPTVGLGFSIKRLFSWLIFEINFFIYSILRYRHRPKVLYISSLSILTFFTGVILKQIYKCKLVLEVRDIWPETLIAFGNYQENSLIVRLLKSVERYGYKNADLIVGSMPGLDLHIKQVTNKYGKFIWIPMGYDESFYRLDFEALENDHNIQDILSLIRRQKMSYRFTIAYAGTLGKANYVHEILEAARALGREYGVFIIGEGPLKEKLMNQFAEENIHFLGGLKKSYLPKVLNEFDLLVNMWGKKKIYDFGVSPNKWIDYMLSERPILVSYEGYRSIINEADCGWFISANDTTLLASTIEHIANKLDSEELDRIGKNGSLYVKAKLSYPCLVERLCKEISNLEG